MGPRSGRPRGNGFKQMADRINLDYYAGTPLLPEVKQAMEAALVEVGNPSSIHEAGRRAKQQLERARKQIAALINAKPEELCFTSCGTESNNWALRGLVAANRRKGNHLIISAIEHPSISLVARRLELDAGVLVTILPVDRDGFISPSDLKAALKPETVLISIMLANGEVGTIEPLQELAAIAHEHGALVHTDAVAAIGHIAVNVKRLGVDALSLAANQFYGPQGAAALFVREGVRILPLLEGGGQEHGGRSGTENVPAIIGMGLAAELAKQQLPGRIERLSQLCDRLRDGLTQRIEGLRVNGPLDVRRALPQPALAALLDAPRRGASALRSAGSLVTPMKSAGDSVPARSASSCGSLQVVSPAEDHARARLPHNLHVCIDGVSSESLVLGLDQAGIAAGLGSACNSKSMRPSHVLKAMGLTDEQAKGALVFSVGVPTTDDEIDRALEIIPTVVQRLRNVTVLTARA